MRKGNKKNKLNLSRVVEAKRTLGWITPTAGDGLTGEIVRVAIQGDSRNTVTVYLPPSVGLLPCILSFHPVTGSITQIFFRLMPVFSPSVARALLHPRERMEGKRIAKRKEVFHSFHSCLNISVHPINFQFFDSRPVSPPI